MRVLYVINGLDGGGAASPIPSIVQVMRSAGHDVFVVALSERDGRARPLLDASGIPYRVIGTAQRRFLQAARKLDAIVKAGRPDVIWTSLTHATVMGQLIGARRGIPVVSWLHNAWLKPANAWLLRRTRHLTRHWVADSSAVARFGAKEIGICESRLAVWPIFIADDGPHAFPASEDGVFRIGSLGRLHRNKGYDVLVRAVARLNRDSPDIARRLSVHIAGEGPERDALLAMTLDLGASNVRFEGYTSKPLEFLRSLHGYVQPSHHEGFCIAAHQALAAGLPVIASPVGEMHTSLTASGGGQTVCYGDAAALADALAGLVRAPNEAAATGRRGMSWVRQTYSADSFAARGRAVLSAAGLG